MRPLVENIVQDRPENIHRYLSQRLLNRNIDLGREATLRIIAVNDVYVLDNFPALNTLIKANSTPNIITVLAGDFVAPSLLSSRQRLLCFFGAAAAFFLFTSRLLAAGFFFCRFFGASTSSMTVSLE